MEFVDEDLFAVTETLIPLEAVVKRLRALQHDHFVETPELLREVGRVRATVNLTLSKLPDNLCLKYSRLYAELHWAAEMRVFCAAESEALGEGSFYRLISM